MIAVLAAGSARRARSGMALLRFACLAWLPACALYVAPSPGGGADAGSDLPAQCDHPEYRAEIVSPSEGAVVSNPVQLRYRWTPGDIPDRAIAITDQYGRNGMYGDEIYDGADTVMTVYETPGLDYTFEVGWFCIYDGGAHEVDFPDLAVRHFTVADAVVDAGMP